MYKTMINALKNESAIDAFDMINVYKKRKCRLPVLRPIKLMTKFKSNFLLKIFLYTLVVFWIIIFPMLMVYKFVKYIKLIEKKDTHSEYNLSNIIVLTSHRIETMKNGVDTNELPSIYLSVPWLKNSIDTKYIINLMSFIDFYDLAKIFMYSLKGLSIWGKEIKHPVEILQSYVLFEYFMMYVGLEKLQEENATISYWYCNHYDRWSVLLDAIGKDNVIIQHGFVNAKFELPYKLKNIKILYYIDKSSVKIFKQNILEKSKKIYTKQLKNTLQLQAINNKEKSILIISRPAQLEFDIALVDILSTLDIIVYIKPHPLYPTSLYEKAFTNNSICKLIEDKDFYPNVKIVISGYSTLAVEYELLGKLIIWIPQETKESIFDKLKQEEN